MAAGAVAIRIDWAEENKAAGIPAFNTGPINLVAPHLQTDITDLRLACIQGIRPGDFDLLDAAGTLVPFDTFGGRYRLFRGLARGNAYRLKLRAHAVSALAQSYVPYRYLGSDGWLTVAMLEKLSMAFYHRVWATDTPPTFKAAFVESAGNVEVAARNQALWFARYFGAGGTFSFDPQLHLVAGRSSKGSREEDDTLRLTQKEGALVRSLVPKHPDSIMVLDHALVWLDNFERAIAEVLPEGVAARSVRLFLLHFLAFFDFTPRELASIWEKGSPYAPELARL